MIPHSKRKNDWKLFTKAFILLTLYLFFLYKYCTEGGYLIAVMSGFFASQSAVNIMHDGNHFAFSTNKYITYLAGFIMDAVFSSGIVYKRSHVIIFFFSFCKFSFPIILCLVWYNLQKINNKN